MGNSIYHQIQKEYGQSGIDYIAFRYHERIWYKRIVQNIRDIKQKAKAQQHDKLDIIIKEKHKLQNDFQHAIKNVGLLRPGYIKKNEIIYNQKVKYFSGFNQEKERLDTIYKDLNSRFEVEKITFEKNIREEVMRKQNKSKINSIKQFDNRSDKTRRMIQDQCFKRHPEKALLENVGYIAAQITWKNYKNTFSNLFDQTKFFAQAEAARFKIRSHFEPQQIGLSAENQI